MTMSLSPWVSCLLRWYRRVVYTPTLTRSLFQRDMSLKSACRGSSPQLFVGRRRRCVGRKREGGNYIPRSTSGVFGFGSAACPCSDSRPEPPAPPGSRSNSRSALPESCPTRSRPGGPLPRLPAAPLAGFPLDSLHAFAVGSGAATHRVSGACHVILARSWPASRPNTVSRIAGAAHGARPSEPSPIRADLNVEFREAGTFAVSDLSARLHTITPQRRPTRSRRGHGRAPARSSAAPRCRSAASPP